MQVTYEYSFRPARQKKAPKFLAGAEAESRGSEIVKKAYIIVLWVEKDQRRVEIKVTLYKRRNGRSMRLILL